LQHNKLFLLIQLDNPLGFFHSWELMCKVIVTPNLTRKLHLPFLILCPLNIFIQFFVMNPTTFLSLSFSLLSRFRRTLQSLQLHRMYFKILGERGRQASGWTNCRLLNNDFLHLVHGQVCEFCFCRTHYTIGMWVGLWIFKVNSGS